MYSFSVCVYNDIESKLNITARNYKHEEKNAISKVCDCLVLSSYWGTEDWAGQEVHISLCVCVLKTFWD